MLKVEHGTPCYICHRQASDIHHMMHGPDRKKADKDGLVCPLCRECHNEVHFGDGTLDHQLKQDAELMYLRTHTFAEYMQRYNRNYFDCFVFDSIPKGWHLDREGPKGFWMITDGEHEGMIHRRVLEEGRK